MRSMLNLKCGSEPVSLCPRLVDVPGDQPKFYGKGKGKRTKEERTLHPLGPLCRQRRHHEVLLSLPCECQSDRQLPFFHELLCVNVRDPIPNVSLPESLLVGHRPAVDRVLFREVNECVYGLNFLGGFTSAPRLPRDGLSRINTFCTPNLLKRPEALEVGEGGLSKLSAGKVYDFLGFSSVSSAATGALAPFRKSHVSLPHVSCQCAEFGAHLRRRGSFSLGRLCACRFQKRIIKYTSFVDGLANIYYDSLSWVTTTRCALTLIVLSSKVAHSRLSVLNPCVFKKNLSLRLILDARRSNPHFRVPPKFPIATGDFSRVSNFLLGIRKRVKRLRFTSLLTKGIGLIFA